MVTKKQFFLNQSIFVFLNPRFWLNYVNAVKLFGKKLVHRNWQCEHHNLYIVHMRTSKRDRAELLGYIPSFSRPNQFHIFDCITHKIGVIKSINQNQFQWNSWIKKEKKKKLQSNYISTVRNKRFWKTDSPLCLSASMNGYRILIFVIL